MPRRPLRVTTADGARLRSALEAPRTDLHVRRGFPAGVLAEAEQAARDPRLPGYDATDAPFFTVDPPGSLDLDQAMHLAVREGGRGYRVAYAIADVAAFVTPGGALDAEAHRRVQTLYFPDLRVPLHPPVLGEGAASLLAGQERPAVLWRIDLDADGAVTDVDVRRALPLRRLVDRYAAEFCVAAVAGQDPPEWVEEAFRELPRDMRGGSQFAGTIESASLDLIEAALLKDRVVGEVFDAFVIDIRDSDPTSGTVHLRDPAVIAHVRGGTAPLPLGEPLPVRLTQADPGRHTVLFTPA
ncbi:RNB domain-containing ribonuclease [Actinacidiphila sp. bgisy160]|uniref:RNB domain-containing ribonuclease n=1 Tax=Actinacidiphila sp. bgisy160 TaxID=3413796 RepID=UPI003D74B450